MSNNLSRRQLLQTAAAGTLLAGVGAAAPNGNPTMHGVPFKAADRVRIGLIGVGARGSEHVRILLAIDNVELKAVCDIDAKKVADAQKRARDAGAKEPAGYTQGERDFENLCRRDDLDLVMIATPWDWHVPMAVSAMENGKHAATEVPAAFTIADCWKLVDTSEKTRRHCIQLENCCYGYNEMMVHNMVRAGLFGDLVHGEAAYLHDLRTILTEDRSEGLWRRIPHTTRNGNLYPTHGLGPVARYMSINQGDCFETMVSMSSRERSLTEYVRKTFPGAAKAREKYVCGDMNTSIIKTASGLTIMLQHNVTGPRPYDRLNMISGTKGVFRDYPPRLFLDGMKEEAWHPIEEFKEQWEDPLWKRQGELAKKLGGHGGMDFLMSWRLVQCMREGLPPDMDVYDAAAWSVPGPLSEASVAAGGAPQKFPDFTRGGWAPHGLH
jgi:hypothetical protein